MSKIGDLIPKTGIYTNPGVITQKKDDGTVKIDTDPMSVNKYHRYTNTTGLSEGEKNRFNKILDDIYEDDDDVARIDKIQNEIDELRKDPKNEKVVQYLKNQQSHLIRESRKLPNSYITSDVK